MRRFSGSKGSAKEKIQLALYCVFTVCAFIFLEEDKTKVTNYRNDRLLRFNEFNNVSNF